MKENTNMKKAILLVLALVLALSLAACGGKDNNDSGTLNRDDSTPSSTPGTCCDTNDG
jgi:uncharacterized lipoprotein YehR (DUF1307 family)